MNKKILLVLALSWIVAGCVSQRPDDGPMFGETGALGVVGCTPYMGIPPLCEGDKNNPKVEIDLDAFTATPHCVNAKKGKRITFILKSSGEIEKGSVVIFPKIPDNYYWTARTNSPNKNKIVIRVPKKNQSDKPFPPGVYEYGIWTAAKCLDPRVNVEN